MPLKPRKQAGFKKPANAKAVATVKATDTFVPYKGQVVYFNGLKATVENSAGGRAGIYLYSNGNYIETPVSKLTPATEL
jgi:hypothetical protein